MTSTGKPICLATVSAASFSPGKRRGELASTARNAFPLARQASAHTSVESTPPEYATRLPPLPCNSATVRSMFDSMMSMLCGRPVSALVFPIVTVHLNVTLVPFLPISAPLWPYGPGGMFWAAVCLWL